jgi:uncharacterized protein with HEPN domain
MKKSDEVILRKIIKYADDAILVVSEYDLDLPKLMALTTPQHAITMCILQIGELASVLSDEVKTAYPGVPWQQIKLMRNIAAHRYHTFDKSIMWGTVSVEIPSLKEYCLEILSKERVYNNES